MAFTFSNLIETPEELNERLRASGQHFWADRPVVTSDPELRGVVVRLIDGRGDTGVTAVVVERTQDGVPAPLLPDGRYERDSGSYRLVVVRYDRPADASPHNAGYPVGGFDITAGETQIRRSPRIEIPA